MEIDAGDPAGPELVSAVQAGDLAVLRRLIDGRPGLAGARLRCAGGRTPLHIVTDWPGYFPDGPAVARLLLTAGADPDARSGGRTPETPQHWAASSDDVDVAEVLIDAGADLEAPGGSIGTPLDNAVGYGCWHVARRLADRGAVVEALWHAAALGRLDRLEQLLGGDPAPAADEIDNAFWQACHGGQLRAAARLLRAGADIGATPGYARGTVAGIAAGPETRRALLLAWLRENGSPRENGDLRENGDPPRDQGLSARDTR
jgi:hypothetical protein